MILFLELQYLFAQNINAMIQLIPKYISLSLLGFFHYIATTDWLAFRLFCLLSKVICLLIETFIKLKENGIILVNWWLFDSVDVSDELLYFLFFFTEVTQRTLRSISRIDRTFIWIYLFSMHCKLILVLKLFQFYFSIILLFLEFDQLLFKSMNLKLEFLFLKLINLPLHLQSGHFSFRFIFMTIMIKGAKLDTC